MNYICELNFTFLEHQNSKNIQKIKNLFKTLRKHPIVLLNPKGYVLNRSETWDTNIHLRWRSWQFWYWEVDSLHWIYIVAAKRLFEIRRLYRRSSRDRCNKSFRTILGPFWCFSYALYGNRKNTRRVPILLIPKNLIQSGWPAKDSEVILVSRPRHLLPYSNFIQFNKIEEKTPMLLNIFSETLGRPFYF